MTQNKILIIGSGKDILKTFQYTFRNYQIEKLSFRYAWKNYRKIKKKDKILISGFHFGMCSMNYDNLLGKLDLMHTLKGLFQVPTNSKKFTKTS